MGHVGAYHCVESEVLAVKILNAFRRGIKDEEDLPAAIRDHRDDQIKGAG